ncbi:TMEM165/GDT1 family protein [Janibacter sp. CX7]|uniref:TMEM165/GDT1 family protein n=1 Tax=Janibacter sp. CX7 TaxID=2963431 RepID=UPI0020CBCD2D|nr:TMEM165/GDT1 family protein [Janibacter sp. CX7]UTT64924.1 TMEM165/GDT1 family protein [Janibacter sp. CX7]
MFSALVLSTVVIFVAELGDKSQLMAMTFATRYRARDVILGITAATALVHLASVGIGYFIGASFEKYQSPIAILAGIAFLGFAAWTLRGDELTDEEAQKARKAKGSALLAVGVAFFLAELGDKTMLATITLAVRENWLGTWIGSTVGMVAADALAIGVGAILGRKLPEKVITYGAAAAFAIFGLILIAEGLGWLG